MPGALVGTIGAVSVGTLAGAVTPAFGAGETRAAGNLLVCYVDGYGTNTAPATPAGWSLGPQIVPGTSPNATATIFYLWALGGDTAPTIAGIGGIFWNAQLAEFSGLLTGSAPDQTATNSGASTPLVATAGGADAAAGELLLYCSGARHTAAVTDSCANTLNNGTAISTNNNGTSIGPHYDFGYCFTTGNSAADSSSFAFSTTSLSGAAVVIASFKLASATVVVAPSRGTLSL